MQIQDNNFDEFDQELLPYRRNLLPWWIKFFSWVFMIFGALSIINLLIFFFGVGASASLYGFEEVLPYNYAVLASLLLMILNGIAGYFLWFEKGPAIILAQIAGIIGLVACILSTAATIKTGHLFFRFEILLFIPFLAKLSSLKNIWKYESRSR